MLSGVVATVLARLEPQPGAVAVRILRPHGIGQFSERLCRRHGGMAFCSLPPPGHLGKARPASQRPTAAAPPPAAPKCPSHLHASIPPPAPDALAADPPV